MKHDNFASVMQIVQVGSRHPYKARPNFPPAILSLEEGGQIFAAALERSAVAPRAGDMLDRRIWAAEGS